MGIVGHNIAKSLIGCTESGRVGDSTAKHADHHGQILGVAGVEEKIVERKHDPDVENNHDGCHQIESDTALLE